MPIPDFQVLSTASSGNCSLWCSPCLVTSAQGTSEHFGQHPVLCSAQTKTETEFAHLSYHPSVNFYKLSLHVGGWQLFFLYYLAALFFLKTLQQFEWFSSQDSLPRLAVAKSSIFPVRCANLGCAWDPKSFVCSYLLAFFKKVKQCLSRWRWPRLARLLTVK